MNVICNINDFLKLSKDQFFKQEQFVADSLSRSGSDAL